MTASPGRKSAYLFGVLAVLCAAVAGLSAPPAAEAAKPCWKRVIDDWVDNGRFDGVYSAKCVEQARKHLPEDVRAYSDIEEKLDALRQEASRHIQNVSNPNGPSGPSAPPVRSQTGEPEPQADAAPRDPGPIVEALNKDTTNADSIPLPLILLAGLALLLMAAGASGIAARKLQARRASVRRPS